MKRKFTFLLFAFASTLLISLKAYSQSVYWREGFEGGNISGTKPVSGGGPTNYYATSVNSGTGEWFLHGTYRTTGTSCSGSGYGANHLRLLQNAADSPFVALPVVNFGVTEIHFSRSANGSLPSATRRYAFFVRLDTTVTTNPGGVVNNP